MLNLKEYHGISRTRTPAGWELFRLRKEAAVLREANEVLKKATLLFATQKPPKRRSNYRGKIITG